MLKCCKQRQMFANRTAEMLTHKTLNTSPVTFWVELTASHENSIHPGVLQHVPFVAWHASGMEENWKKVSFKVFYSQLSHYTGIILTENSRHFCFKNELNRQIQWIPLIYLKHMKIKGKTRTNFKTLLNIWGCILNFNIQQVSPEPVFPDI